MPNLLKVRLSLKGRPIRTFTFNQKTVSIGRDPASDVFLDNTGVSRQHARIQRTPGGYVVEDLGSANGTLLNDQAVRQDFLGDNDVIQIGKFSLWMSIEEDRRDQALLDTGGVSHGAFEGTTVLSPDQLKKMQRSAKEEEVSVEKKGKASRSSKPDRAPTWTAFASATIAAFVLGILVGVATTILYHRG
jgi:pSer/pThr/pTyr-binding forkhead associated (FHA) protein